MVGRERCGLPLRRREMITWQRSTYVVAMEMVSHTMKKGRVPSWPAVDKNTAERSSDTVDTARSARRNLRPIMRNGDQNVSVERLRRVVCEDEV